MIYGFIKLNNKYIGKDEQERSIKEYAEFKGLEIDRYLLDDYKRKYSGIYMLKKGYGTGTYIFNLKKDDIIICSNFYTLAYSYKTILFLIKEILKREAKIYCVDGDIEIDKSSLKTMEILYDLRCLFDNIRHEKNLRFFWKPKLEPYRDQIEVDVQNGILIRQMSKKYHASEPTISKFIKDNPKMYETYKKTNSRFGRIKNKSYKLLSRTAFLKREVDRQMRKAQANISPEATLLLSKKMEKENKK